MPMEMVLTQKQFTLGKHFLALDHNETDSMDIAVLDLFNKIETFCCTAIINQLDGYTALQNQESFAC